MSSNNIPADESRVPQVLAGIIIPTILASAFVIARLYTRSVLTRNWGHDDTLITIAWFTSLGLAVTNGLFVPFGLGRHVIYNNPALIIPSLKVAFVGRIVYQLVLCFTKLGICLFYLRVFQDKRSKYIVYIIAAFTIISTLIIEVVFIFQCNPVSDAWRFIKPNCKPGPPSMIANTVCSVVADICIMAFVIPRVLPLQMAPRQKASLLGVVSLGVLVIAASVVRCYLTSTLLTDSDLSWNGYQITTWTTIEVSTGLFCASAPCIRPLLRQIAPGFMSSLSQTTSGPSKTAHTGGGYGAGSKYGLGSVGGRKGSRIGKREVFELRSTGDKDGDGETFWIEGEENRRKKDGYSGDEGSEVSVLPAGSGQKMGEGQGNIMKTISVSVTSTEATSGGPTSPKPVQGWQNV